MKLGNTVVVGAVLTALFALNVMTILLLLETDDYVYRLRVDNYELSSRLDKCEKALAPKAGSVGGPKQAAVRATPTRHAPAERERAFRADGV